MKLPPAIKQIVDIGGLITGLVVDIVMNVICFKTLAPDPLTAIAFIAIGVMIVLFVFRSWSKNQIPAWIVFVAVVFFFDYSYTLEATRAQSNESNAEAAMYTDSEIIRIDSEIKAKDIELIDLRSQYDKAMKRETLAEIKGFIDVSQSKRDQYEIERKERIIKLQGRSNITSKAIFDAIPNAIRDGRIMALIVFALIFLGLQFIIASSTDRENKGAIKKEDALSHEKDNKQVKTDPIIISATADIPTRSLIKKASAIVPIVKDTAIIVKKETVISHDLVSIFVNLSWYRLRMHTADFITPEDVFFDFIERQKRSFPRDIYKTLVQKCMDLQITDIRGCILVKDETKVAEMLNASS